ncbi:hypothetical protein VTJ04DRAFT_1494 [Mycothermus thermophilus]|uniref:uncharacterized protein n=1 Tax=Humicola insolens TaxID=85995 RepID=UPI003743C8EF
MPPLVNYSSDSDSDSPASPTTNPPKPDKRPRTDDNPSSSSLPPLPATFHDLYASTVRAAPCDDPALHQGRVRQIPHLPGHWPSHVYVEWIPPAEVYDLLEGLVGELRARLQLRGGTSDPEERLELERPPEIYTLLHSDLGAPLPLHISLSRPMSLPGEVKEVFKRDLEGALLGKGESGSGLGCGRRFEVECTRAEWHRTHESARSFLVLRLRSVMGSSSGSAGSSRKRDDEQDKSRTGNEDGDGDDGDNNNSSSREKNGETNPNPELTFLLRHCNAIAARYNQPMLYDWADEFSSSSSSPTSKEQNANSNGETKRRGSVGNAFHISIAWSHSPPTPQLVEATEAVFCSQDSPAAKALRRVRVPVAAVKIKIGNVVSSLELPASTFSAGGKGAGPKKIEAARNLFGL